jgi:tetratricopeptide (TPR) repeat protein
MRNFHLFSSSGMAEMKIFSSVSWEAEKSRERKPKAHAYASIRQINNCVKQQFTLKSVCHRAQNHRMGKHCLNLRWRAVVGLIGFLVATGIAPPLKGAQAGTAAATANYIVLDFQNIVLVAPAGTGTFKPAVKDMALLVGDRVRVGPNSGLVIQRADKSTFRAREKSEFVIPPPKAGNTSAGMRLLSGALYFFHRGKPGDVEVESPTTTAAVRGTEFNFEVEENGTTTITVIDGVVDFRNEVAGITVQNGQQGVAEVGKAPVLRAAIDAINVIQWTLYYPGILDADEIELSEQERGALRSSLEAYRSGDLLRAINEYPAGREAQSNAEKIYLAGLTLAVGRVEEAQTMLGAAAEAGSSGANRNARLAGALQQVIAAVKMRGAAPAIAPELASEWLAESYRLQSVADLEGALKAARAAVEKSPNFGFGWARVAELEFGFGRIDAAAQALSKSLQIAPRNAQAIALEGFLLAARNEIDMALRMFDAAIEVDGRLANAWLGRGLMMIRKGRSAEGRENLMTAAALEPQRASLRSYLGKAWTDAGAMGLAEHELELAKELDERDPTAWLYSALLKEQQSRVNEAIRDLEKSKELNDNRAIYRSRMLLDQDRAVRGANLARLYADADMPDVGVREAGRAVAADYSDYSAHLFLANSYEAQRRANISTLSGVRFEAAAFSEYLLANLLGPASGRLLAQSVNQLEHADLFERNRLGIYSSTEYFSRGAWRQSGAQFGTYNGFSYSLEAEYRTDPGERPNQDFELRQLDAKVKQDITPDDSVYFHVVDFRSSGGDISQRFDPSEVVTTFSINQKQAPTMFVGYHHQWTPQNHTLFLAGRVEENLQTSDPRSVVLALDRGFGTINGLAPVLARQTYSNYRHLYTLEAQQIASIGRNSLIVGARGQWNKQTVSDRVEDPDGFFLLLLGLPNPVSVQQGKLSEWSATAYFYDYFELTDTVQIIGGVDYTRQTMPVNTATAPLSFETDDEWRINPKAGVVWSPSARLNLRGSYTRSLNGSGLGQSIRLEPTHVAGMPQTFRDPVPASIVGQLDGAKLETAEIVAELKYPDTYLAFAAQRLTAKKTRHMGLFLSDENYDPPPTLGLIEEHLRYEEHALDFSAHRLLSTEWSFGMRYRVAYARLERNFPEYPGLGVGGVDDDTDWRGLLHTVSVNALYRHNSGVFARAEGIYFAQQREQDDASLSGDTFWQLNTYLGYRFLSGRAEASVGLLNLLDNDYRLDPINPHTDQPRSRTFYARLLLSF